MKWSHIKTSADFDRLLSLSGNSTVLIFKHSTRCNISRFALKEFEQNWNAGDENKVVFGFLDLLEYRKVSDAIANALGVKHESPQVLLIKNGVCFYSKTHQEIDYNKLLAAVEANN